MVTGSSLVLYSRLNLVLPNPKFLRFTLITILGNAVLFQLPNIIMTYISGHGDHGTIQKINDIFPKLDIIFTVQEAFLSSLYVFVFIRFLNQGTPVSQDTIRTFYYLFIAEIVMFVFNIIMYVLLYLEIYLARRMVLGLFYAIKLKIEFIVLNRLVVFAQRRQAYSGSILGEVVARNTMTAVSPSSELSRGSKLPISRRLDAFSNGSEFAEAVSAARHLTGSREQRAQKEENKTTPMSSGRTTSGDIEEGSQDSMEKLERLERMYLGPLGPGGAV
jgi:hypothetical protein